MRQAVLQVNLNTIKFAMHPAWGVGNLVFHILKNDQELSDLTYIGDFSARDYLNIMNGIKDYEVFSVNDEIKSKRSISYSRDREEFERIMYNGGLKRTENDPAFNTFCSSLESKFFKTTL